MENLPKRIFLQVGEDCPDDVDFNKLDEITWSKDRTTFNDIEYVHTDVLKKKISFFEDKKLMLELCIKEAINLPKGQEPHLYSDYLNNNLEFDEDNNRVVFSRGYVDLDNAKIVYNK